MGERIWQEFYCNDCDGYFRVKLNVAINMRVEMVCPNCGRKHPRSIRDGRIVEAGHEAVKEEILVPKSAYSKESLHSKMIKNARDGEVFKGEDDLNKRNPIADAMIKELWFEFHGGK